MKKLGVLLLATIISALASASAAQASPAVVLLSGFDTTTPFSSSAPNCAGREGPTWNPPTGIAAALRSAGYAVFTAPVLQSDTTPPPPCLGPGQPAPPPTATIRSNSELDANGRALIALLQFLATNYGVTSVQLVAHSDGGLWSRSAINQIRAGSGVPLTVQSLTTLGTPHTGSFGADLAVTLDNGRCAQPNRVERLLCEFMLDIIQAEFGNLGPEAIEQLTHTFLAGWNPRQSIGCPVSVIGGTYLNLPIGVPTYYDPDDGIVGIASALAASSTSIDGQPIPRPNFQPIGRASFPVVHSASLSFLTPDNLLNQTAISSLVLKYVRDSASLTPCAATGAPSASSPSPAPPAPRVAFQSLEVPSDGSLAKPAAGEVVVLGRGASLRCGRQRISAIPLLGSRRARVAFPRCRGALRAKGRRVMALRPDRRRVLQAHHDGRQLHLRVTGPRLRRVRAEARVGGRWVPIKARGSTPLVLRGERVTVRASGRARNGRRFNAVTHVIRGTLR
jgi:triacylglycerol lipase